MSAMKIWRTGKMHFSKLKQYLQTQTSERAKPCDVGQVPWPCRMVHLRLLEFLTPSDMLAYLELGTSNSYSTVCLFVCFCFIVEQLFYVEEDKLRYLYMAIHVTFFNSCDLKNDGKFSCAESIPFTSLLNEKRT